MNVKQVQTLLKALDCNPGAIDGIWGQQSQAALDEAVAKYATPTKTFWDDCKNFSRLEFRCRCGGTYCDGYPAEPKEKLVRMLQKIRDHYGKPVNMASGLRCETWNRLQGGVDNSRHRNGQAADIWIAGVTPESLCAWVRSNCPECAYTYVISKNGKPVGTVHVDVLI